MSRISLGSNITTLASLIPPKYFFISAVRGLNILCWFNSRESVASIFTANFEISSPVKVLFNIDSVALIVAPISAVELAIPFPTGIWLFILSDIFLVSSTGNPNFSKTSSIARRDFLGPFWMISLPSSKVATENKLIAYDDKYSSLSKNPWTNSPQDAGHTP